MRFKDVYGLEQFLKEYPTPVSQQKTGQVAKANSVASSTPASKSPSTTAQQPPAQPTIAKAKELDKDYEFPDEKGNVVKVVSPVGQGKNKNAVVVQNQRTKEFYTLQPDDDIALPQVDSDQLGENLDDLLDKKKRSFAKRISRKQNKLKQLIRAAKFDKQGEPIFEINFNSADVIKSALDAPIQCGFEAETVWTNMSGEEVVDLDDADADEVRDLVWNQEGQRQVDRIDEAFREWLSEYAVYDIESEVVDEMVAERREDEGYIDEFVEEHVDMDDVYGYKEDYLDKLKDTLNNMDDADDNRDELQDEIDEREEWDTNAWAREYVEQEMGYEFREWLTEDISDNGEAWDEAWNRALEKYDWFDWMRREYNSWYHLLNSHDVYVVEDEEGGIDAVASQIEDWASNGGSKTNDVRAGGYHSGESVDNTYWRVEVDPSIQGDGVKAEIISPMYNTPREMLIEMKNLFDFFEQNDVETNRSTGMHITMSLAGEKAKLNPLKLALLLGDQYVLTEFGRQYNTYTASQKNSIDTYIKRVMDEPAGQDAGLEELETIMTRGISHNKYSSINFKNDNNESGNKLIEFRIAGGNDYHKAYDKLAKAVVRYGATLQAAYDPAAYRKDYLKAIVKTIETAKGGVTKKELDSLPGQQIPDTDFADVVAELIQPGMKLDALENVATIEQALSGGPAHDPYEAKKAFMWIMQTILSGLASGRAKTKRTSHIVRTIRAEQNRHGVSNSDIMKQLYQHYKSFRSSLPVEDLMKKAATALEAITMRPAEPPQFKAVIKYSPSKDQVLLMPKAKFDLIMDEKAVELSEKDFKIVSLDDLGHVLRAKIGNFPEHYPDPEKLIALFKKKYGIEPGNPGEAKPHEWINVGPAGTRAAEAYGIEIIKESKTSTVFDRFDKLPLQEQLKLLAKVDKQKLDEAWSKKYKRSINCDNPKGFSQKAHCAGKKKNETIEAEQDMAALLTAYGTPKKKKKKKTTEADQVKAKEPKPKAKGGRKEHPYKGRLVGEGVKSFDELHRWRVTFNNGKSKVVRAKSSSKARDIAPPSADWRIIGIRKIEDLGPASDAKRIKEGAVPETSLPEEYKKIMSKPLLGSDLRGQMEAYQLVPDPKMVKAFRVSIAEAGKDVDLRSVFKSFAQAKLHPSAKKAIGLNESRGVTARQPGETYINAQDPEDVLTIKDIQVFPPEADKYDSYEELEAALADALPDNEEVVLDNQPNKGTMAAIVATVSDIEGNPQHWIRYIKQIPAAGVMGLWKTLRGYRYSKGAEKESIPLKPTDILPVDKFMTGEQLATNIVQGATTQFKDTQYASLIDVMTEAVDRAQNNSQEPIAGAAPYENVLAKYGGEYLGPLALIQGGNTEGDTQQMLDAYGLTTLQGSQILFPGDTGFELVDSLIKAPDGQRIGLSSKIHKGGGAASSLKGVAAQLTPEMESEYPEAAEIVKLLGTSSAVEGPLKVAKLLGVLDNNDIKAILDLGKASTNPDDITSDKVRQLVDNQGVADMNDPSYRTLYHALAAVVNAIIPIVNSRDDFVDVMKAALNNNNFIQLTTNSKRVGDGVSLSYYTKFPAVFEGAPQLYNKSYFATGQKGRLGFKMKKGSAAPAPAASPAVTAPPKVRPSDLANMEPSKNIGDVGRDEV